MLPVTISLGLINFNLLINSFFGSLVSDEAPAAIEKAFRIYQLPQGIFSVAIATVLFPTLARFANAGEIDNLRATMANGMRQILFVLVPAAAAILVALGTDHPARLPARRIRPGGDDDGRARRSSGSPSRCRPTASTCCRRGPSSASSGPGGRPALAVIDLVVSALAALAALQAVRRRRHRRRHGDRHQRGGRRPGGRSCGREFDGLELGRLLSTDGADHDRLGRAGRRQLGRLGRCSTMRSAATSLGQIVSLGARPRGSAASPTSRSRSCCGSPSSSRSSASCAAARMLGAPRYLLGVARDPRPRSASSGLGASAPALAPRSPASRAPRPSSPPRPCPRSPDLGGRGAWDPSALSRPCRTCWWSSAVGVGLWCAPPAGGAGRGGPRTDPWPARRPPSSRVRTRRPEHRPSRP